MEGPVNIIFDLFASINEDPCNSVEMYSITHITEREFDGWGMSTITQGSGMRVCDKVHMARWNSPQMARTTGVDEPNCKAAAIGTPTEPLPSNMHKASE